MDPTVPRDELSELDALDTDAILTRLHAHFGAPTLVRRRRVYMLQFVVPVLLPDGDNAMVFLCTRSEGLVVTDLGHTAMRLVDESAIACDEFDAIIVPEGFTSLGTGTEIAALVDPSTNAVCSAVTALARVCVAIEKRCLSTLGERSRRTMSSTLAHHKQRSNDG